VAVLAELWWFKNSLKKWTKKVGSDSGWVGVVPLDRGDQCGSNGIS
jgi:hypothetical protein